MTASRGAQARLAGLGALALLALLLTMSFTLPRCSLPSRRPALQLTVGAYTGMSGTLLEDVLPLDATELRFAGNAPRACHLHLFGMTQMGAVWPITQGGAAPGAQVGPGEFRLGGGFAFSAGHPQESIRFFAVCGGPELRQAELVDAARLAVGSFGWNSSGVIDAQAIPTLPEDVLQTSRLFRMEFR